jgi:GNAT superfamily N-acetyltransferase
MWVECFEKDLRIESDDLDEVADRFVTHAREAHDPPYPDAELRQWALNFAEASVRECGPTRRLDTIGEIEVHPVDESRIDDWLTFFDRDAFPDNPDWASCYCMNPHEGDGEERPWRETRAEMVGRLGSGATRGYLAYVDGVPAGWVNASYRSTYRKYADIDPGGPDPRQVVGVSCFVIAPAYRRHGVSTALLERVIADAQARGARFVEGYPRHHADGSDAESFRGTRSMFDARAFRPAEEHERFTVMRRAASSDHLDAQGAPATAEDAGTVGGMSDERTFTARLHIPNGTSVERSETTVDGALPQSLSMAETTYDAPATYTFHLREGQAADADPVEYDYDLESETPPN